MNVQIINKSKHPLPAYATELSAGMDIRANLSEPVSLAPMQRCLVPTGLYIALPPGFGGTSAPSQRSCYQERYHGAEFSGND